MRKTMLLALLFFAGVLTSFAQDLKVMTYNIRLDLSSDGVNAWDNRKQDLISQIDFYDPDVFGVQEARPNQVQDLAKGLPQYGFAGVGRGENNTDEASNIYYRKDRFTVKQSGTFWLSETPAKASKGWDAAYNRICTYALLLDKQTKKQFWYFNTHLDNEGALARKKGVELILAKMKELNKKNLPVIFSGDLNSEPSDPVIALVKTQLADTRELSVHPPFGPTGTFNNFRHDQPVTLLIDYIFIGKNSPFVVNRYAVLSDSKDLRYPSDHLPVLVELNIRKIK